MRICGCIPDGSRPDGRGKQAYRASKRSRASTMGKKFVGEGMGEVV
jgi:hypothetical protein